MGARILRWLFFTILLSLIPILASYIQLSANKAALISLTSVLRQGDLFLLCSGFCASALGELIGLERKRWPGAKIMVGGAATLVMLLCVFLYAAIRNSSVTESIEFLANISISIFIFGAIISVACVALSEMKDA
ncbi:hypothetical protein AB9E29_18200 [Rhizobium leguminosarum]|uniref:hypothetical protein n=1 Tax=Rhizobium leguminosarum TaxID=384 RepID=UPI00102FA03B|nr:hypothetical protein [Rhizobium leguminosarum]TAZ05994.1 hypothetical protein ELH81_27575 [Rhizobium leguminosarum]